MQKTANYLSNNIFKSTLRELLDYLDIPDATFGKNCNISTNALVKGWLDGTYHPTKKSLNKILDRYPVNIEWLLFGTGKMWKVDYFKSRYEIYKLTKEDPSAAEIVENLVLIFDTNPAGLNRRLGLPINTLHSIINGKTKTLSEAVKNVFLEKISFIPRDYYH
ncbi:hypothetical protein [uncultured Chryseobacterium sp.]|uniref:hypothetical protein n=1 Tax=uncultured Chryseobacterium sp. TaxID=259322 RepID=UPI0025F4C686|nr:hypothetical protein [uncultured Chryseobacterium sp.]